MFTAGICGMAFMPLGAISSRAEELHRKAVEEVKLDPASAPPSFFDQMKLQLARFDPNQNVPTCELAVVPTFASGPSKRGIVVCYRHALTGATDPPTPGKRYITIMGLVNCPFSRGTVVSLPPLYQNVGLLKFPPAFKDQ